MRTRTIALIFMLMAGLAAGVAAENDKEKDKKKGKNPFARVGKTIGKAGKIAGKETAKGGKIAGEQTAKGGKIAGKETAKAGTIAGKETARGGKIAGKQTAHAGAVAGRNTAEAFSDKEDDPYESSDMLSKAQAALQERGYYRGAVDGIDGPRTQSGLREYQGDHNLAVTGKLNHETAESLGI